MTLNRRFQNNEAVVSFRFDAAGGRRFGEATSQNVGKHLAIVLDDQVISAPQIREPILGGSGVITGGFSVAEAQDLALLLRAGALPAPLEVLEERTVGPGLGSDSIRSGVLAGVVGSICVVIFMIVAYGTFGLIANLALVVNGIMLVAAMSALQATLTLPGIAGIVLTIGMAVDANVLIFEHIREEIRTGRTPVAAIDSGFTRALTTIIDSNLDDAVRGGIPLSVRLWPGAGIRRDARDRHHRLDVHRGHFDPAHCRSLAAAVPAPRPGDLRG